MRLDFIPGTMCDERVWGRLQPYLGSTFSAHYVSLAGRHDRASLRQTLVEDTAPRANLVGFSMGGYLALEHALAHPERVQSLTLISASARGLTQPERQRRERVLEHLQDRPYTGMPQAQILSLLGGVGREDAEAIALIREMDRDLGKETLLSQLSATMERPDLTDALHALHCPVLIVGAREDSLVQVADLEAMEQALPNGKLVMVASGHMVPLEAPEALASGLMAFLAKG